MSPRPIERLQVTSQYYVIHFRVAKPLVSLECYKSIWSVLVVRTIVLREIIKQREKWEFIFTEFRKIRVNERFGSTQLCTYQCYAPLPPTRAMLGNRWGFEFCKVQIHHPLGTPVGQIPTFAPLNNRGKDGKFDRRCFYL